MRDIRFERAEKRLYDMLDIMDRGVVVDGLYIKTQDAGTFSRVANRICRDYFAQNPTITEKPAHAAAASIYLASIALDKTLGMRYIEGVSQHYAVALDNSGDKNHHDVLATQPAISHAYKEILKVFGFDSDFSKYIPKIKNDIAVFLQVKYDLK